jgi:hydrogenase maturation protease
MLDARRQTGVVVVGVGNELLGDEGFGVHVARALVAETLPPGVSVLEAGTALLDAAPEMSRASRLILVNAVRIGASPGTIHRLSRSRALAEDPAQTPLSLHEWGVVETLQAMEKLGLLPDDVEVIGAEPACLEPQLGLSARLVAARDRVLALLLEELQCEVGLDRRSA